MTILIAPDKFKGSLTAMQACNAIEIGLKKFNPTINTIKHPLADGGEGTLSILNDYFDLEKITVNVKNPIFKEFASYYMVSKDTAYIEMANASGLHLLKEKERNCSNTTSFGTGQLILDAINKNYKNIVLFIGGSATNDGGVGMATALGYRFIDKNKTQINPTGKELQFIDAIENDDLYFDLNDLNVTVVSDVKNTLYGINGAAFVYGSQKGASEEELFMLDLGLQNFSKQVSKYLGKEISNIPGAGAAGGLGAGAVAFLDAKMQSGIDFVMEQTGFNKRIESRIDFIITGEGSVDKQTIEGKVIKGVSDCAKKKKIPFYIISGVITDEELIINNLNPKKIYSIMELGVNQQDAIQNAEVHLAEIAFKLIKNESKII